MHPLRIHCSLLLLLILAPFVFQAGCSKSENKPVSGVEEPGHSVNAKTGSGQPIPNDVAPESTVNRAETTAAAAAAFANQHFEAPFRLMVKDAPLNTAAKQMYPSPAMYDVDQDGQDELIVGDIFGRLNVYENQNDAKGDPVWSSHYALNTADGEAIKVSNW